MGNNADEISINGIFEKYGHGRIEFLKMDIEKSEYSVLPRILDMVQDKRLAVCHVLLELHDNGSPNDYYGILLALERAGFYMYSKELLYCGYCAEYSFIHKSCFEQYGLSMDNILYTFENQ